MGRGKYFIEEDGFFDEILSLNSRSKRKNDSGRCFRGGGIHAPIRECKRIRAPIRECECIHARSLALVARIPNARIRIIIRAYAVLCARTREYSLG